MNVEGWKKSVDPFDSWRTSAGSSGGCRDLNGSTRGGGVMKIAAVVVVLLLALIAFAIWSEVKEIGGEVKSTANDIGNDVERQYQGTY